MSENGLYDLIIIGGGPAGLTAGVGDLRKKYANQIVLAAADGCTAALASAYYVETLKN